MKTAEQWQTDLAGETSVESIREIQADAMLGVVGMMANSYHNSDLSAAIVAHASRLLGMNPLRVQREPNPSFQGGGTL